MISKMFIILDRNMDTVVLKKHNRIYLLIKLRVVFQHLIAIKYYPHLCYFVGIYKRISLNGNKYIKLKFTNF